MPTTMENSLARPRLIHVELRPLGEDGVLAIAPSGDMFEVACTPRSLGDLLKKCDGARGIDEIVDGSADPDGFREVIEALLEAGALSNAEAAPGAPAPLGAERLPGQPERLAETRAALLADRSLEEIIQRHGLASSFAVCHSLDRQSLLAKIPDMDPQRDIVVVTRDIFDRELLAAVDTCCREHGISWASCHLDRGKGWLGPVIVPGQTADYQDLIDRRMCCSDRDDLFEAEMAAPIFPDPDARDLPNKQELLWMLSLFFLELERWRTDGSCQLFSTELEADPKTLSTTPYSFLPMPHRRLEGPFLTSDAMRPEALINHRSGAIVRSLDVVHHDSVPKSLTTIQAHVSNIARKYPCANDVIVGGSSFGDRDSSFYSSIGEAIERYCGNYIPGESLRRASYNQLMTAGEHAIDPDSLALFSETFYQTPGCPMAPFTRDMEALWVEGRSLTRNRPAWLPVSLVYVNWHTALTGEPLTNYYWFPGIAAGVNMEHALVSGLEEIVERDITMIWWMNRQRLPAMKATPELEALWDANSKAKGQRPWLIYLENEFDIPVMAGALENTIEGYFNIGFGCRPDPVEAARKAWTEALTLQEGSRDMDDPNGLLRTSVEEWGLIDVPYKPWRKDRRYLDDYRPDFRDVSDLLQQQQVNLDPRCLKRVREWVDTPRTRAFSEVPSLPDRSLQTIQDRIESRGYEIFYKDITTADVALTGLKAARVIVPGLVPNTSAAFPPLGGGRVLQAPVAMGWRDRPLAEADLNYAPLPHA